MSNRDHLPISSTQALTAVPEDDSSTKQPHQISQSSGVVCNRRRGFKASLPTACQRHRRCLFSPLCLSDTHFTPARDRSPCKSSSRVDARGNSRMRRRPQTDADVLAYPRDIDTINANLTCFQNANSIDCPEGSLDHGRYGRPRCPGS